MNIKSVENQAGVVGTAKGQKLKKAFGNFFIEIHVKAHLSGLFLTDALEWLLLYESLEQNSNFGSESYEAKKFIMLRSSVECILKSLIISSSKSSEKAAGAYKTAVACSHNLSKLHNECNLRLNRRRKIISPKFLSVWGAVEKTHISLRYSLNHTFEKLKQSYAPPFYKGNVSVLIMDDDTRKAFFNEAKRIYYMAMAVDKKRFKKHRACLGGNYGKVQDYIWTTILGH